MLRHNSRRACGQRTQRGLVRAAASASRALPYAPTVPAARTCHSSAHGPTRRPVQAIKSNRPGHALRRAVPAAPADWPRTEQARPAAAATGEPTRNRRPLGGHWAHAPSLSAGHGPSSSTVSCWSGRLDPCSPLCPGLARQLLEERKRDGRRPCPRPRQPLLRGSHGREMERNDLWNSMVASAA